MTKPILLYFFILFLFLSCTSIQSNENKQNLLNSVPHVEDSIIMDIPKSARLCDNMDINKQLVEIGDCKIYYEIEGEGIPLVLINGGPGGTHHCFHPWLTGAKDKFKIIYYDQRGCGLSDFNPGEGYSFEQTIDDLEKLRIALKIDKWIVLGHSFGGGIAQYYAIKYPQNLMGTILVGSVPMINKPELNSANENWALCEKEKSKKEELVKLIIGGKLNYAQYFYNDAINGGWKRQNYIKPEQEMFSQLANYDIVFDPNYSSDYQLYDFEHAFKTSPIPTLICEGKYDSLWSSEKVAVMKKNHPNAKFEYFEYSSHNIYSDEPEHFIKSISGWADEIEIPDKDKIAEWKIKTNEILGKQFDLIANNKAFINLIKNEGAESAEKFYNNFKKNNPGQILFLENSMNALAYSYMDNNISLAIELFRLNVKENPQSWNVYDSLAEAYLKAGKKQLAFENYEKSLELNPKNENARNIMQQIEHR